MKAWQGGDGGEANHGEELGGGCPVVLAKSGFSGAAYNLPVGGKHANFFFFLLLGYLKLLMAFFFFKPHSAWFLIP